MADPIINLDQLVEQLVPLVLARIRSKSTRIETLPVQQDMTGITSLPGYDTTGGQHRAVLVPIEALKEPARAAGAAAQDAASKANAAAAAAQSILNDIQAAVKAAELAVSLANEASKLANAAANNVAEKGEYAENAGKYAISSGETALAASEQAKSSATEADKAADNANTAAENANTAADNANAAYSLASSAKTTADDALAKALAAVDAIATLKGMENSDEAMALIAQQISKISVNSQDIAAIKASTVDCSLDEYLEWEKTGSLNPSVEYNIYED